MASQGVLSTRCTCRQQVEKILNVHLMITYIWIEFREQMLSVTVQFIEIFVYILFLLLLELFLPHAS